MIRHDSYLDLSRAVAHPSFELDEAKEFGRIDEDLCRQIIERVEAGLKVLPARYAEIFLTNLRKLL
ncbi:hypothetical protein AL346_06920 [Chelatococcus sp. CO-6]|nr:hypothetical protein AL346_06920 [Chelatococcus sp. CO-6]